MQHADSGHDRARKTGPRLCLAVALLLSGNALVQADCSKEDLLISRDLASKAAQSSNDTVRLLLLKRSVDTCSAYPVWLELGKLQMQLDNPFDAVYAFEHAVDFTPRAGTSVTSDQLMRRGIANARLGEAYLASGELAMALVATQEAVDAFDRLEQPVPRRLVQLQARLDDAVSLADAEVMARSIEVQQDRASRGTGARTDLLGAVENLSTVNETLALLSDYSGDPVSSATDLGIDTNEPGDKVETAESGLLRPLAAVSPQATEARLNIPVLFEFDSARLTPQSLDTIGQLATALASLELGAQDTVMVVGHTDARGSRSYNMTLSRERAKAVADVLQEEMATQGAPALDLLFQGRGESELRYSGEQADDHRRNRRVEVIISQR